MKKTVAKKATKKSEPKIEIKKEVRIEPKVELVTNEKKEVPKVEAGVIVPTEPIKVNPVIEEKVIEKKVAQPAGHFDEFVIKEIMNQKGTSRERAIQILSNPTP